MLSNDLLEKKQYYDSLVDTGLMIAMETILQAEQAAVIASTVAVVASSTVSN